MFFIWLGCQYNNSVFLLDKIIVFTFFNIRSLKNIFWVNSIHVRLSSAIPMGSRRYTIKYGFLLIDGESRDPYRNFSFPTALAALCVLSNHSMLPSGSSKEKKVCGISSKTLIACSCHA